MYNYADEIRADIRYYHGERFAPRNPSKGYKEEIDEAIAITNAMTEEERASLRYLAENNFPELIALRNPVTERAGL